MQLPPSAGDLPALAAGELPASVVNAVLRRAGDQSLPVSGYFYDLDIAVERARGLREALPPWAEVFYAVKANSYSPLLHTLRHYVDGFEVASAREAELAAATGDGVKMVAAGPGKSGPLLAAFAAAGVQIVNVESLLELHRVNEAALRAGRRSAVAVRVNPDRVEVSGSLQMGGTASQFGLPEAAVPEAIALARGLPGVDLVGFHLHAVCNNLDAEAHARYVRWCLEWSARVAHTQNLDLRVVNVGGGLGVPFGADESPFDVARFGEELAVLRPPDGVRVLFEPGRYLVTECGFYAAEVTDVKQSGGRTFAIVRGGINHFQIPTSWDILHRFAVVPIDAWPHTYRRPGASDVSLTVVGELCTPEDTLAVDMKVTEVRAGDVIVFPMAGSYGYEFAMPEFLGHPPAGRWLV